MSGDLRVPRFRRGTRFRFDAVRDAWILLAPEKLFMPDAIAVEILKLVDGERTIEGIVDELVARFAAPRAVIDRDVAAAFEKLALRGAVEL
ncbi:pyrroloquinoline quinone biosynthesis peptide chaperone PqqD [Sphingomonas sp.]|uniref:pyrroloquinoline quinone biosynthesis peptide chaperone PqqD n=1 Tax=Sphingomonas sp. TaxID=28214 RepID=UPI002D0F8C86|nr:pyrroloquinoline quinone biosynthesis peptide chaperone PqqD [Sphingomonas sp.]HTG38894.1 pyrroloquinoline quinone biosynthesis peptide chaperone PqqD [Sphingomonas sp.]